VLGEVYARQLMNDIGKLNGRYLRDEAGRYYVVVRGQRVSLTDAPDNLPMAFLILQACNVSMHSQAARAAIQRVQVEAAKKAGQMQLRFFSALSRDSSRLYIPCAAGKLLLITADGITCAKNGENQDHFWVEHPNGGPLQHSSVDVATGLAHFERLLVETQACTLSAMRWLVAMHAGFFPYVRDSCPGRFLLELIGPAQSGKTSGAQRFTLLQGLGDVKGDFSPAALSALGDIGLLVLDNREQANFTQPLIDFCLFLATGAERGRAEVDGRLRTSRGGRPVAMITTIEGVVKAELQERCVEVQYGVSGQKLLRAPIEREISELRHEIQSAMIQVLARYFQFRGQRPVTVNPVPNFEEHFTTLCDLLRAFGEIAGKPPEWADEIIHVWNATILSADEQEDDLEHPITRVINECVSTWPDTRLKEELFTYEGLNGELYVTTARDLLTFLQKLNLRNLALPQNAQGLSRRLKSCRFSSLKFLPTDTPGVAGLKRTSGKKPIGFFRPVTQ
jgi:hypothetical protein